jgi:hypothetical protein
MNENYEYEYGLYNINNIKSTYLNGVFLNSSNFFINIRNDYASAQQVTFSAQTIQVPITYINNKKIIYQGNNTSINNYSLNSTPSAPSTSRSIYVSGAIRKRFSNVCGPEESPYI